MKNEKVQQNQVVIELHLVMLQDYLDKFKSYFEEVQIKTRQESIDETFNILDALVESEYSKGNIGSDIKYTDTFDTYFTVLPKLHYSSFLVTWYSLLESELKTFCTFCKEVMNLKDYKKIKNCSEIESIKTYLKDAGICLDKEKWSEVDTIRLIRNKVVHLGPDFDKKLNEYNAPKLKNYIDKQNLMPDGKYKSLFIHYDFCNYLLNFTRSFFIGLYSKLDSLTSMDSKATNE